MTSNRTLISNGNPIEEIVGFSKAVRVGSFIAVGGTAPVDKTEKQLALGTFMHKRTKALKSSKWRSSRPRLGVRISFAHASS